MVKLWRSIAMALVTALFLVTSSASFAEEEDIKRVEIDAEYRLRGIYIDPLGLNSTEVRDIRWGEQRLRLDMAFRASKKVSIFLQMDILDGVLMGDNGTFGGVPAPNSGVSLASVFPNVSIWDVGLASGKDPVSKRSYVPVLKSAPPIEINLAYGEVVLPIGILRAGRQPTGDHLGGRSNRWGVSKYTHVSDRVLFGTKLDEAIKMIGAGPGHKPDLSTDQGVFLAFAFDWMVQGLPQQFDDDLLRGAVVLQWKQPTADWGGQRWRNVQGQLSVTKLFNRHFNSAVWAFPAKLQFELNDFTLNLFYTAIVGHTFEVSEGFAELSNRSPSLQDVRATGARAQLDWKLGPITLTVEGDYATGDADPRSNTAITGYGFPRDENIGLLLFEHILAFESARSVGVGVENLASLNAASFPISEAGTDGRFTDAIAFFPQMKIDWVNTDAHKLHTRLGVLFAWTEQGAVDPIMTILTGDGVEITDDAINFHGGTPGDYYGTEFDAQIGWEYEGQFHWVLEGAFLMPGDALHDQHGDAVPSFMVENRFLFLF